jgi:LuxR family transcriptional regulator, maltose regulon positive regulatory protein
MRLVDVPVVVEEAQRLLARTEAADTAKSGLSEDLRAAVFISLGVAEIWALRFDDAKRHLAQGVALARQIGRPYLELTGLTLGAHATILFQPDMLQAEQSRQAIELAERHGWAEEPLAGWPTLSSASCCCTRDGWMRQNRGCSAPSVPCAPRWNPRPG